jgi:hypothetical protein
MTDQPTTPNSVKAFLDQIEQTIFFKDAQTQGSLAYNIEFYRRITPRKRWAFRISGGLVIFLSATLPIFAAFGGQLFGPSNTEVKDLLVASIATLIAILSGLNAFFRWDVGWRGQISAMLSLQNLRAQWEIRKAKALIEPDPAKGLAILEDAVEKLMADANSVIAAETEEYFTVQKFPDSKTEK